MGYKQDLERKRIRDQKIYQYHLIHPWLSSRQLGKRHHLSHSMICLILKKQGEIVQAGLQDRIKMGGK